MSAPYPPAAQVHGYADDWFIVAPAAGQIVYRLIGNPEPRLRDFQSWRERDRESERPPRYPDDPYIDYISLSMFESEALAVENASIFPAHVATVHLEAENGFSLARTDIYIDGHYSVWGDPEKLLRAVVGTPTRYETP